MGKIRFIYLIILLITPFHCFSRQNSDTVLINRLLIKSTTFRNTNPDSMFFYLAKAEQLSDKAVNKQHLSRTYQQMAEYYKMKEDYGQVTDKILKALRIEEQLSNASQIAKLNTDLGKVYAKMEKFPKAMGYYTKSLDIYNQLKDSISIGIVYSYIGKLHRSREFCEKRTSDQKEIDYQNALKYYEKSMGIFTRHHSDENLIGLYLNMASVHNMMQKGDKALPFVLKAMNYYKSKNDLEGIASTYYNLGITYRRMKQYDKAVESFRETIRYGKEHNITEGLQFVYEELSQAYYEAGDYKNSRDNYVQYMILRDSIYNQEKSKQIFESETKYQTEKKEKQILTLTLEKKRKQQYVYLMIGFLAILGLGGTFLLNRARNKTIIAEQFNRINEQKIKEMEQERQLIAAHAVLHGEESERTRLARDLHDGLGGLLSGLKLSLNSIKGNIFLSEENVDQFNKAMGLLDVSMRELRRVAHNMMPEALSKFGLKDALTDFCMGLDSSQTEVKFRFYGIEKRLEQNLEICLYRISQELINNALKHANATEIILLIVQEEKRIHLTVQDNGVGFDPEILNVSKGSGIPNIRSRVEALNGQLEIFASKGKGSEISVEFILS